MNARVQELFHELADVPAEARARYFAEHEVDQETRQEVEELLAFDSGASSFLLDGVTLAASRALPQLEERGRRCGPYRLLDVIGRGGMGAVYLAERIDGEVTQRLAVKLLPAGAGDAQRERFLQERQIFASLAHPNIARMLDAGHVDGGQPFLAMEYVDGKPIDVFAAGLSLRQKVALFVKVSAAVAYLHRNLVVHRDLKPSNILVTPEGEPKLLDFGIAKILDGATDSTMTSMRMLTPDYASPEQVAGGRMTTATDIYSLGAVLYRLLTGKPAHEFEDHSSEAIAQVVTTREVTRPGKWAPELKGDLEFILLKALRKDPRERYATVEQFSEDLQAFLESRTVQARSGSAWYRTRKLLRRYWVSVSAASLVIASLSAGLYIANRQRVIAERRFSQLRQLAHQVIFDLEKELSALPGAINARKKLVATATQYLAGLGAEAFHDKDLALEVGESYLAVARIQGVPAWNNLGEYAEAEENLRLADKFLDSVLSTDPRNRNALWLSANSAHDHASVAMAAGWPAIVLASSPKVAERFNQLVRLGNLSRKEINGATYIYGDLAEDLIYIHRFKDAVHYARLGAEISMHSPFFGPRAQVFSHLAMALMDLGDVQGAQDAIQEARSQVAKLFHQQGYTVYSRAILALVHKRDALIMGEDGDVNLNRPEEAAAALQEGFDLLEQSAKTELKDYHSRHGLAEVGRYLADILRHSDPNRALEVYDHTLMRVREVPKDIAERREEASLLAGSSYAAHWIRRDADARERIDAAFGLLRDTKDYPAEAVKLGSEPDIALRALGDHYAETGQPNKAIEVYQELRRKVLASKPDVQNDLLYAAQLSQLDASLSALLRRVGRTDEALSLEQTRAGLWRHWGQKLPNNPFVQRQIAAERVP